MPPDSKRRNTVTLHRPPSILNPKFVHPLNADQQEEAARVFQDAINSLTGNFNRPSMLALRAEGREILRALRHPRDFNYVIPNPNIENTKKSVYFIPGTGAPGASLIMLLNRIVSGNSEYAASNRGTRYNTNASGDIFAEGWSTYKPNIGPTPWIIHDEIKKIIDLVERTGSPITIVGHSLGGMYGLILARALGPEYIEHVIAVGSPCQFDLNTARTSTNVGFAANIMEAIVPFMDENLLNSLIPEEFLAPLGIQYTAIYGVGSQKKYGDGIVNPFSCIPPDNEGYLGLAVPNAHMSMITDPSIAKLIEHLIIHGNQGELPDDISSILATPEDIARCKAEFDFISTDTAGRTYSIDPQSKILELLELTPNGRDVFRAFLRRVLTGTYEIPELDPNHGRPHGIAPTTRIDNSNTPSSASVGSSLDQLDTLVRTGPPDHLFIGADGTKTSGVVVHVELPWAHL